MESHNSHFNTFGFTMIKNILDEMLKQENCIPMVFSNKSVTILTQMYGRLRY